MKTRIMLGAVFGMGISISGPAPAADTEAGKAAAEPCFACHGSNGVSVSADIPNLAAQKEGYLVSQLEAFRAEERTNPLMNAMAGQLSDQEIENLAAFFSSLPGPGAGEVSDLPEDLNKTRVAFPDDVAGDFTHYKTINFPDRGQVRRYLANEATLKAAAAGEPLPDGSYILVEIYEPKLDGSGDPVTDSDGLFEPDKLIAYTAMAMNEGWGDKIPVKLRNGDWNYAVFTAEKKVRSGVNQAKCLACHKPLDSDSYVFTLDALKAQGMMQ